MEQKLRMGLLGKRKREEDRGGRVNKSRVKLSGLQPRVFTALVSITNKSPQQPRSSLELHWLYWEQQIKEASIWV